MSVCINVPGPWTIWLNVPGPWDHLAKCPWSRKPHAESHNRHFPPNQGVKSSSPFYIEYISRQKVPMGDSTHAEEYHSFNYLQGHKYKFVIKKLCKDFTLVLYQSWWSFLVQMMSLRSPVFKYHPQNYFLSAGAHQVDNILMLTEMDKQFWLFNRTIVLYLCCYQVSEIQLELYRHPSGYNFLLRYLTQKSKRAQIFTKFDLMAISFLNIARNVAIPSAVPSHPLPKFPSPSSLFNMTLTRNNSNKEILKPAQVHILSVRTAIGHWEKIGVQMQSDFCTNRLMRLYKQQRRWK